LTIFSRDLVERIKAGGDSTSCIAFRTFSWLRHAARPLKVPELCEAILIDASKSEDRLSLEDLNTDIILSNIISNCKSSVIHEEASGEIRFVHSTFKTFLEEQESSIFNQKLRPETYVEMSCTTYLGFVYFDKPCLDKELANTRAKDFAFCQYAAQF